MRPKVKVSVNVSFASVGVPSNPSMKLLGGAPGREEEEEVFSKSPLSPKVRHRRGSGSAPVRLGQSPSHSLDHTRDALYGLGWYGDEEEEVEGDSEVGARPGARGGGAGARAPQG